MTTGELLKQPENAWELSFDEWASRQFKESRQVAFSEPSMILPAGNARKARKFEDVD